MSAPLLKPQLRFAELADIEEVVRLINAAFVVERFFIDSDRTNAESVGGLMQKGKFLLAEDGYRMVACIYLELRDNKRGYIGLLAVDPSLQKSGLGRLLVTAGENYLRDAECKAVDMRTVNLRVELPAFYRKLGYIETGIAPFEADAEPSLPCHFVKMSKILR